MRNTGYHSSDSDSPTSASESEGGGALLQGAGATWLGYLLAGALSFGLLELFSRWVTAAAGEGNSLFFSAPLLALSSVCSTSICATAVCPFEASA